MKPLLVLKKFILPVSITYTLVLLVLSLVNINKISDIGVAYQDKFYHIIAYFLLAIFWNLALNKRNLKRRIVYIALASIMFGIIIETLQGSLTSHRANDVFDIVANTLGVIIASVFMQYGYKKLS